MNNSFTLLAPEVIGTPDEKLRATILVDNLSLTVSHVPFQRKHTMVVFLFLLSKARKWNDSSVITLTCSTKEIIEGIGGNLNSNSIRTQVNLALNELHQVGLISLYSRPQQEVSYPYQVINHQVTDEVIEFGESKKHDHQIQINPNFVYDKSCQYYLPVPNDIISHKELNYTDKLVYISILKFSWSTSAKKGTDFKAIKLDTICNFLNLKELTVKRATKKLESLGLIQKFMKIKKVNNEYQRLVKYVPLQLCVLNPNTKKLQAVILEKFEESEVWGE